MIQAQMPPGTPLSADGVSAAPLDAIVQRSTEQIHALTKPLAADMVKAMKAELVRAVAVGDSPRTTGRRILKRTEGKFNGGLTRAMMIARTEVIDAGRAAALVSDQAYREVLDGWEWHASLDARTCISCLVQHGTRHDIDEPGPLDHHQGRCARIPVTKSWKDLGFTTVDEPKNDMPDSREWFDNLTPDTQQKIMGKARLQAFNDGKVSWDQLSTRKATPGWRDSYHVTPLKELTLSRSVP